MLELGGRDVTVVVLVKDLSVSGQSWVKRSRWAQGGIKRDVNQKSSRISTYLESLSDLLFILARAANALAGRDEPLWKPGATRD